MIYLTILNLKIDEKAKERIRKILKVSEYKTISDFVRSAIDEKLKIAETRKENREIEPPDWIPEGKYYAIVKGAIVAVNDTPSSLAKEVIAKFPYEYVIIKRKNKEVPNLEYVFSSISTDSLKCWPYFDFKEKSYPIFPITLIKSDHQEVLSAIPDTAASLTVIKDEIVNQLNLEQIESQPIQTTTGIYNIPIYEITLEILDKKMNTKIIPAPISNDLPFQGLIGRNVLDLFDLFLFGKKKLICMR